MMIRIDTYLAPTSRSGSEITFVPEGICYIQREEPQMKTNTHVTLCWVEKSLASNLPRFQFLSYSSGNCTFFMSVPVSSYSSGTC